MKDLLQSSKIKAILWILGACIILLLVFGLGAAVGYRRAIFASGWGQNYYHNFSGPPNRGVMGGMDDMMRGPFNMHGVSGDVLGVASSTISVKDSLGNEQSVAIASDTVIRMTNDEIPLSDVTIGEWITVIGSPNAKDQIEARFIRVFASSSSLPTDLN